MEENIVFPYDTKWEQVKFETPAKRIINFNDVTEYQQRPIHQEYLDFLADLQKVPLCLGSQSFLKKYQTLSRPRSSKYLSLGSRNLNNF